MAALRPTLRAKGLTARWPATVAVFAFIIGILVQDAAPARPSIWLASSCLLLMVARVFLHRSLLSGGCLVVALGLIGLARAQLDVYYFPPNHIALFTRNSDQLAELELGITEPPRIAGGLAENRRLPLKQIAAGEAIAVQSHGGWQASGGQIVLSVEPPDDQLHSGQTIRALGWLSRPTAPENPGQFDGADRDRRDRILAMFRVRRAETIQIVRDDGPSPTVRLHQAARRLLAAGFTSDQSLDADFLQMLLLGDAPSQMSAIREDFDSSGTAYQLSVSGLHLAILTGAAILILRLARVSPVKAIIVLMAFTTLYAVAVLPSQAGWRSLLMCWAAAIGLLSRRAINATQLLSLAVLVILMIRPEDLYDAGFQISVVAVIGLIVFAMRVNRFFTSAWKSDEPWTMKRAPQSSLGIFARALGRIAWQTLLVSSVIWISVMPLVAYYFQQTNPWSVPAGVLLLPITAVTLLGGVAKLGLTLACPPLAHWWAVAAGAPAALLRYAVGILAHLPASSLSTSSPKPWTIALYYALLILPLIPWRWTAVRWLARGAPILACLSLLVGIPSAANATALFRPPIGEVRVTFLDIGAGQTALVRVQNGQTFFVDCGSTTVPNVFDRVIKPYLEHEGIGRVDQILLSHGDYDHICAAAEIVEAFGLPIVRMTPHFRRHAVGNFPAEALLQTLDLLHHPPVITMAGDRLDVGGGASLQVLWPPLQCAMNSNNCGMVLKLCYAGRSILFPADIQVPPELELLKHPDLLKSDVLVAPHHGSAELSTLAFIRAVNPSVIVASNDRMLTQKQHLFDAIATDWPVYRTDRCGAIDVRIAASGKLTVTTFNDIAPVSTPPHLATAAAP